ncbi:MAG: DUF5336 domain-containing protein [Nocardiaceae bacterium]|nr:DUF5336 domain-containing protein [Nocardiaceae bacterium]
MSYTTGSGSNGASQQFPAPPQQPHPTQYVPGYQPQAYSAPAYAPRPARAGGGLPFFLALSVIGLGIVNFLLGFAPFAKEDSDAATEGIFGNDSMSFFDNASLGVGIIGIALLLLAAMITAVGLLPRQSSNAGLAAATSVTGFVTVLFTLIGLTPGLEAGVGLILVAIFGFVQAAVAVAVVLLGSVDAARPPVPAGPAFGTFPAAYGVPGPMPGMPGGIPEAPQTPNTSTFVPPVPGGGYGDPGRTSTHWTPAGES